MADRTALYVERFFGTLDEAMKARGVGEFVLRLHLPTATIYVVTDQQFPRIHTEVISSPGPPAHWFYV